MGNARHDGSLLFRQLLRIFRGAYLEEYYKNGTWDMETLALDLELLEAHHKRCRLHAGAPEPPPLEDIPEVVLPEPIEVVPPWRKTAQSSLRKATPNGIKLNAAATAALAGRGLKRTFASMSQAVGRKGKGVQLAGKGIVVPGKGAQILGKGTRLSGQAKGKGEQPPGIISQLLAKGTKPSGKASGKGVQLPGKDGQLLVSKGTKPVGKAIGKGLQLLKPSGKALGKGVQLPGKDCQLVVSKGTKKGSKELAEGSKGSQKGVPGAPAFAKATQLLDKGSQKGKGKGNLDVFVPASAKATQLLDKGSHKGTGKGNLDAAPAFAKSTQLLDKGSQKGKGKGKRAQYVKSGAVERFKAMQGQGGSVPLSNSKAGSLALANSKAGSPAFTKAGSPAFTKAGPPNRPRIVLSKFAKRAANGARVTMSKEVKEKFLDADDLD